MSFGVFEAALGSDAEVKIARQASVDKFHAAVYDVREKLGSFLLNATSIEEFRDRVAMAKDNQSVYRIIESAGLHPSTGIVRRIVGKNSVLENEFRQTLATVPVAGDEPPPGWTFPGQQLSQDEPAAANPWKEMPGFGHEGRRAVGRGRGGGGLGGGGWKRTPDKASYTRGAYTIQRKIQPGGTSEYDLLHQGNPIGTTRSVTQAKFMADNHRRGTGSPPTGTGSTPTARSSSQHYSADAEKGHSDPYGDVDYADPGYRGKARYPVNTKEHADAAKRYFDDPKNEDKYSPSKRKDVKDRIDKAVRSFDSRRNTAGVPNYDQNLDGTHGPNRGPQKMNDIFDPKKDEPTFRGKGDFKGYLEDVRSPASRDVEGHGFAGPNNDSRIHRHTRDPKEHDFMHNPHPDHAENSFQEEPGHKAETKESRLAFDLYRDWCAINQRSPHKMSSLDAYAKNVSDERYLRLAAEIQKWEFEHKPKTHSTKVSKVNAWVVHNASKNEIPLRRFVAWSRQNGLAPVRATFNHYVQTLSVPQYRALVAQLQKSAAPDYLQKADEALTNLLNQKAEEFQETIGPLQQALMTVQQAEQVAQQQNPLSVLPTPGTVNVLPGQDDGQTPSTLGVAGPEATDPGAAPGAMGPAGAPQSELPGVGDLGALPPTMGEDDPRQQMAARHSAGVADDWKKWQQAQSGLVGGDADYDRFAQDQKISPGALEKLRNQHRQIEGPSVKSASGEPPKGGGRGKVRGAKRRLASDPAGADPYHPDTNLPTQSLDPEPPVQVQRSVQRINQIPTKSGAKPQHQDWSTPDLGKTWHHPEGEYKLTKTPKGYQLWNVAGGFQQNPPMIPVMQPMSLGRAFDVVDSSRGVPMNRSGTKASSRTGSWIGWGTEIFPEHTVREVVGWKWDSHLDGYTAKKPTKFACHCGGGLNVPSGFRRCKCGKQWNSYVIGRTGRNHEASADIYIVREIPVRENVVMANRSLRGERTVGEDEMNESLQKSDGPQGQNINDAAAIPNEAGEGLGDFMKDYPHLGSKRHRVIDEGDLGEGDTIDEPTFKKDPRDWARRDRGGKWTRAIPRK